MMDNTRALLKRTRERLADPESWCQSFYAQDAEGAAIGTFNPAACRWCLLGALSACNGPMRMNLSGLGNNAWDEAVVLMGYRLGANVHAGNALQHVGEFQRPLDDAARDDPRADRRHAAAGLREAWS